MQERPRITIVTPSYNQKRYLGETIESVLAQNYPSLEYFIVDGASTDGSVDLIRSYESKIDWWISEPDAGQTDALEKGLTHATGELFAWVNSDDILLPGCLDAIAESYQQHPSGTIFTANVVHIDSASTITRFVRHSKQGRFLLYRGVWHASAPAIFFNTSAVRTCGGLNTELHLSMDFDLWMRLMKQGATITHIPEYLGAFRWHDESKTVRYVRSARRILSPEGIGILQEHGLAVSLRRVWLWRNLYRLWKVANLNFPREYLATRRHAQRQWQDVFSQP